MDCDMQCADDTVERHKKSCTGNFREGMPIKPQHVCACTSYIDGVGLKGMTVNFQLLPHPQAGRIANQYLPEWRRLYLAKAAEYGEHADGLGLMGQYAEIHRKIGKLKKVMWDQQIAWKAGQPVDGLAFEKIDEVIFDMIGHLFLALDYIRMEGSVESAPEN